MKGQLLLPTSPEGWEEADHHFAAALVPSLLLSPIPRRLTVFWWMEFIPISPVCGSKRVRAVKEKKRPLRNATLNFTTFLRNRWLSFMLANRYLDPSLQKAFMPTVSGCNEHQFKLSSILHDAQYKHKSLAVCWLDLVNEYGSVHHSLIQFSLLHCHAPPQYLSILQVLSPSFTTTLLLSASPSSRFCLPPSLPRSSSVPLHPPGLVSLLHYHAPPQYLSILQVLSPSFTTTLLLSTSPSSRSCLPPSLPRPSSVPLHPPGLVSLLHYHAPPQCLSILQVLYSGLSATVLSADWEIPLISLQKGVYQGDPLSVVIFNTVMNTLVDTISSRINLGYQFSSSSRKVKILQYADDTCLVANSPDSCQYLLSRVSQWLGWSGLAAKVSRVSQWLGWSGMAAKVSRVSQWLGWSGTAAKVPRVSQWLRWSVMAAKVTRVSQWLGWYGMAAKVPRVSIHVLGESSTGVLRDPHLHLGGVPIPCTLDPVRFLRLNVHVRRTTSLSKNTIFSKVDAMMKAVDKLLLYSRAVCPHLTWPLLIQEFPPPGL